MKLIFLIFLVLFYPLNAFAINIFDSEEYELNFSSNNINITKQLEIDEIKIKSFKKILKRTLNNSDYKKISEKVNDKFVNKFILSMKINDEKIINNNYFSRVKITFNKKTIINYYILNQINFVNITPDKFLIIVYEEGDFKNSLLSKKNHYFEFLLNNKKIDIANNFIIPNLDFNDRFIFNESHFGKNEISQIHKLNYKYKTNYSILIHSKKLNGLFVLEYFLIDKFNKYKIGSNNLRKINYEKIFNDVYIASINKWKIINSINTSIVNSLECKITINNLHELKFVKELLKINPIISRLDLKSIKLNENIYDIVFFGNIDIFKNSLIKNRLDIILKDNICIIKII